MGTSMITRLGGIRYNVSATRLFPNVIIKNGVGDQFITSANLLAVMCANLKEVIWDIMNGTDEPLHIVLSGYSQGMLQCLDEFLHEGIVNVKGPTMKECEEFCSELRHEFEQVLGVTVPAEFWELMLPGYDKVNDSDEHVSESPSINDSLTNMIKVETTSEIFDNPSSENESGRIQNGDMKNPLSESDTETTQDGELKNLRTLIPRKKVRLKPRARTQFANSQRSGKSPGTVLRFPCQICSKVLTSRTYWSSHMKKEHPEDAQKYLNNKLCLGCKRIFTTVGMLEWHQRSKSSRCQEEKICDKCGKISKNYQSLQEHIKGMHSEEGGICKVCGKEFRSILRLNHHFNIKHRHIVHCQHCELQFKTNYELKLHVQTVHTANDKKPFICKVCGKGFGRKNVYIEHCSIHSSEKPFKCRFCPFACASSSNISKHEKLKHKDLYTPRKNRRSAEYFLHPRFKF